MLINILPENRYLFLSLIIQLCAVKMTKKNAIFLIQCASIFDFIFLPFNFFMKEHNNQLTQLKSTTPISISPFFERNYFAMQQLPDSG